MNEDLEVPETLVEQRNTTEWQQSKEMQGQDPGYYKRITQSPNSNMK